MTNDSARNYCSNFPLTTLTVSNSGTLRAEKKKPVEPHFQTWKLIAACHVMKEHVHGQKKSSVFLSSQPTFTVVVVLIFLPWFLHTPLLSFITDINYHRHRWDMGREPKKKTKLYDICIFEIQAGRSNARAQPASDRQMFVCSEIKRLDHDNLFMD